MLLVLWKSLKKLAYYLAMYIYEFANPKWKPRCVDFYTYRKEAIDNTS